MRALAVALLVLGTLDALLALTRGWRSTALAIAAATSCAVAGGLAVGFSPRGSALLAATVLVESIVWVSARRVSHPAACAWTLGTLTATQLARVATAGLWHPRPDAVLDRWVATSPFSGLTAAGADRVIYVAAATLFLAAAGNTFVRLLLRSVNSLTPTDAKTPGGGRVIGSIERVLIFALALAGEPTAATLVVSAKGILRFAEVRATPAEDIDRVTEYVLVGSLASYALALAFVPLA